MSLCNCNLKCNCTAVAIVVSLIVGIIATFLQITAVITVTPVFLWVLFGIAVGFLGILTASRNDAGVRRPCDDRCGALNALLIAILGTILLAVILLAVGIVATSVVSAILVGLLVFFFSLVLTSATCYVRSLADCES